MKVSLVPIEFLHDALKECAEMLAGGVAHAAGRWEMADVVSDLEAGNTTLWTAFDGDRIVGAVVLRIVDYPRRRYGRIEIVGGTKMEKWGVQMLATIEGYAKHVMRCDGMEAYGRMGWSRVGKARGYLTKTVLVEKDL